MLLQLLCHDLRCIGGSHDTEERDGLHVGQLQLSKCGYIWQSLGALGICDSQYLDALADVVRSRRCDVVKKHVNLSTKQICERWCCASIGYVHHTRTGNLHKQVGSEVRCGAIAL